MSFFSKLFGKKNAATAPAAPASAAVAEPTNLEKAQKAEENAKKALNNYKNNPFGAPPGLLEAKKVAANAASTQAAWNAVMKKPRQSRHRRNSRRNRSRRSAK
jgi:hypothetical protein